MEDRNYVDVFKPIFIGLFVLSFAFGMLCVIGSLFGVATVEWNGEVVTGWKAFAVAIGISFFFSLIFGMLVAACSLFGTTVISKLKRS